MGDGEAGAEDESSYGRLGIFMAAVWAAGIEETRPVLVLVLVAWAGTEIEASLGLVARVFSSSSEAPLKMSSAGSFPAFPAGRGVSFWGGFKVGRYFVLSAARFLLLLLASDERMGGLAGEVIFRDKV